MTEQSGDPDKNPPKYTLETSPVTPFVLGWCTFFLSVLAGIPAIITGHRVLSEIRKAPAPVKGKGFAVFGIVLGWLSILGLAVVMLIVGLGGFALVGITGKLDGVQEAAVIRIGEDLQQAISDFQTEYGTIPIGSDSPVYSGPRVMNILMAEETGETIHNPRKIVFFTAPPASHHTIAKQANGISRDAEGVSLWDAWGNLFRIEPAENPGEFMIRSPGKDRKDHTSDDILISP